MNIGVKTLAPFLNCVAEASLSLNGRANEDSYYLSFTNEASKLATANLTFQHVYQIYKSGASPIEFVRFTVKVPIAVKTFGTFTEVFKPRLIVSGDVLECSSSSVGTTWPDVQLEYDETVVQGFASDEPEVGRIPTRSLRSENPAGYDDNDDDHNDYVSTLQPLHRSNIWKNPYPAKILYFNCSTHNVDCYIVSCDLGALKTSQDVRKVVFKFHLNTLDFAENLPQGVEVLKFSTEAKLLVLNPKEFVFVNGTRSDMNISTVFYSAPKQEKLSLWIIILSISVGLILLLVIVGILSTMGFFKRNNKEKIEIQQVEELLECNEVERS